MVSSRPKAITAGVIALAVLIGGLEAPPAAAADPRKPDPVSAEDSVISVPATAVERQLDPSTAGTGRPQATRAEVSWPTAGTATVSLLGRTRPSVSAVTVNAVAGSPSQVSVVAYDRKVAERLGGHGLAVRLTRADGMKAAAPVGVQLDVSGFAQAYGGNFESRLRLIAKPACALTTPAVAACADGKPVPSRIDLTRHALIATVPASADQVYVVAAAPNGDAGSYTATKLSSSSKWSVGLQSGDFNWSYPIPKVAAISGKAPDLDLSYSSQSVDGMTASENAQPSWTGLGWNLETPYLERRYNGCSDDGGDTGDLCWAGDQLMLSLEGTSSELVKDKAAGGDIWRAKQDPGWRVERKKDADNGDNDGEYWVVSTPQGMTFTFGRGKQATTGTATNSVFTVPVFGDDDNEPCHQGSVEDSWCTQAWRWNLDGVVDAHGNSTTYFYETEKNRYARNGESDKSTEYIRGGHVRDIVYSQRSGEEGTTAPARLHFTTELRCLEAADGSGTCPAFDQDHASSYPDVPMDQVCTGDCTGDEQKSPSFFTGTLLRSVAAQRSEGDTFVDVDRVDFTYSFPKPSDGTSASLWLEKFQQVGLGGSGEQALPAVVIAGRESPNRVDAAPGSGVPKLEKLRVTTVTDELGRRVEVGYGQPDGCTIDNFPEGKADTNAQTCFPGWRSNDNSSGFGWWHRYLVSKVTVVDQAGGAPPQVNEYRYRGKPSWHYDDDDVTPTERKTWSDWRGYGSVDVVKMSDPGFRGEQAARPLELTRNLFFQGMDGDRLAGGGTKSVDVVDSTGASVKDSPWLRGKERETQQFQLDASGNPTYELGGSLHSYVSARTTPFEQGKTDPDDDAHLVVESESVKRETVLPESGGSRSTRTTKMTTTYDEYGQATEVVDAAGDDVRCTRTSYSRDAATVAAWMLAFPYRVRSYEGSCSAPKSLLSAKDQYYDGSDTVGGPVSKGDVTKTVAAVTASGPNDITKTITTSATFDAYGRTLTETDANGHTSKTAYAPAIGRPSTVTETNALGHVEVTTLEPDRQQPATVKDANNQVSTTTYDPLGRLANVRLPGQAAAAPDAKVFSYRLDPDHNQPPLVTTKELQSGTTYVTKWSFLDSQGRERQEHEVSPASTADQPKTIVTDTRYDDAGHVAAESLPVVVDAVAGSALQAIPADKVVETRHSYDAIGRNTKAAHFAQGKELWASTTEYFGDHQRTTPPPGGVVKTSWTDIRGRQVKSEDGTGSSVAATTYTYYPSGQLATTTDPGGHKSTFTYDLLDRRIESVDPDSGRSRTQYDDEGNAIATWDAKTLASGRPGPTISTQYDALDRPIARWAGPAGTGQKVAEWTYDSTEIANGIGRGLAQTTLSDGKAFTRAATGYDARGRITGRQWTFPQGVGGLLHGSSYTMTYGYDEADHLVSKTYLDPVLGAPKETITTGYDNLGNPTTLSGELTDSLTGNTHTDPYVGSTSYASDGKLAGREYANAHHSLRRAYSYEQQTQRLARIQTIVGNPLTGEDKTEQDDGYSWDPAGNIQRITDVTGPKPVATCFDYDGLNRLSHGWTTYQTDCSDGSSKTVHDGPAGFNQAWTYSPDGNVTSATSLGHTKQYTYGDPAHPHAVTRAGAESFKYDANGAMIERPGLLGGLVPTQLAWNAQQQLESETSTLVSKTQFVYAPDGTRMARVDPLGVTAVLYIDGEEITVVAGVIKAANRFYEQAGVSIAVRQTLGNVVWQLNDTQGSAQISVADGTGIAARTYYSPYGEIRNLLPALPTEHGWLDKIKDPSTGLNALGARYYDASLARFLSTDPASDGSSAQAANPYSYGENNPITYVDPTGLWSLSGAWNAVKSGVSKAVDWVDENKGLITNIAVGIGVGIAIGAVCATGVGCLIAAGVAAGAAGAAAGYGVDVAEGKKDFSWGGLATEVGVGAAVGGLTAGIGAGLGAGARALANTTAGKAVTAAASKAGTAVANSAAGMAVQGAAKAVTGAVKVTAGRTAGKVAAVARQATGRIQPRVARDVSVNPKPPAALPLRRPIGTSPTQNAQLQNDIQALRARGATDFRVNQQQVNINGERVGVNRPDLQYTLNGRRHYAEYDTPASNRGGPHKARIIANDPTAKVHLYTVP
ncbi:RHS repeat-associated core domain-containing protein [Kribbella sp. NPDC023972]|uniref:RHS repeat-associated core domain-containing protein n=1 Tax=Kribbella sp. NPDC023972 TaxID=3154795 RepID=UPI0033CABEC1